MEVYIVLYEFYNDGDYENDYYAEDVFHGVYSTWDKAIEAIKEEVERTMYTKTENYRFGWITQVEDDEWEDSPGQVLNLDFGSGDYVSSWHGTYDIV
jgi:hypothetical protein